jgi:hypothetical protein
MISERDRQVLSRLPVWNPAGDIAAQRRAWEELAIVYNHDLPAIGGQDQVVAGRGEAEQGVGPTHPDRSTRIWCDGTRRAPAFDLHQ